LTLSEALFLCTDTFSPRLEPLASIAMRWRHDTQLMTKSPPTLTANSSELPQGRNEVSLVGAVSSIPISKTLPSGDVVVEFRIVIDRASKRPSPRREVDSLEIAVWKARYRKSALRLEPGDWVEISGSVHRRFWTSAAGLASRWQIEADVLHKL